MLGRRAEPCCDAPINIGAAGGGVGSATGVSSTIGSACAAGWMSGDGAAGAAGASSDAVGFSLYVELQMRLYKVLMPAPFDADAARDAAPRPGGLLLLPRLLERFLAQRDRVHRVMMVLRERRIMSEMGRRRERSEDRTTDIECEAMCAACECAESAPFIFPTL